MKKLLWGLCLLLFCACKKEKEKEISLAAGTYHATNTLELEMPVMYTANGSNTDSAVIKSYLKRAAARMMIPVDSIFVFKTFLPFNDSLRLTVEGETGTLGQSIFFGGPQKLEFSQNGEEVSVRMKDTVMLTKVHPSRCSELLRMSRKYHPDYFDCIASAGTNLYCKALRKFPLLIRSQTEILLPYQNLTVSWGNVNPCTSFSGGLNLSESETFTTMGLTDTLVVQQFYFKLIR